MKHGMNLTQTPPKLFPFENLYSIQLVFQTLLSINNKPLCISSWHDKRHLPCIRRLSCILVVRLFGPYERFQSTSDSYRSGSSASACHSHSCANSPLKIMHFLSQLTFLVLTTRWHRRVVRLKAL